MISISKITKLFLLFALALFFHIGFSTAISARPPSLCTAQEDILFNCPIRGKDGKYASLCASKDLSAKSGTLKYRFGSLKKVELEYPSSSQNTLSWFKINSYFRGGGVQNAGMSLFSIVFEKEGYRYAVFSDYTSENNRVSKGVRVNDDKEYLCGAPIIDHLQDSEKYKLEDWIEREQ